MCTFQGCNVLLHCTTVSSAHFAQARLDDYGIIKCLNYIRAAVKQGSDPRGDLAGALSTPEKPWADDKYLFPVLQNDSLLCHEFDTSDDAMQ